MSANPSVLFIIRPLLTILFASLFRNYRWTTNMKEKACSKISASFNLTFTISSLKINGWGKFTVKGLHVQQASKLQLSIPTLCISLCMRSLLKGRLKLSQLSAATLHGSIAMAPTQPSSPSTGNKPSVWLPKYKHYQLIYKGLHLLFKYLPSHLSIHTMEISLTGTGQHRYSLAVQDLELHNDTFSVHITALPTVSLPLNISGHIYPQQQLLTVERFTCLSSPGACSIIIPQRAISFTSKNARLEISRKKHKTLSVRFLSRESRACWNRLASSEISIPLLEVDINCILEPDAFIIEETSVLRYNELCLTFSAKQDFKHQLFNVNLLLKDTSITGFLNSFPFFHYKKLYDLRFTGSISAIGVQGGFRMDSPWEHFFELTTKHDQVNLATLPGCWPDLTSPFIHDICENGKLIRRIDLSDANSSFLRVENIPEILVAIILECEDANFFKHRGIDIKGLGYSIIQNAIKRDFSRGASTITMQLVRNLFLNHDKTIYRKIEETFITLLLENTLQVPKKRILELYLNIIEFGQGIYGVNEACNYYFSKPPAALTITECLVLSYIIPRPKYFLNAFLNASEQLKRNLRKHIELFSRLLFLQGILDQDDINSLSFTISIKGKTFSLM